ncbi:MAG: response regulator [Bacteroidales bacterium]|nr:response regulator [Bacteroidales bacterium]
MKRRFKISAITVLSAALAILCSPCAGAPSWEHYSFDYTQVSVQEGLTHQNITSLHYDKRGILLVGTQLGVSVIVNSVPTTCTGYFAKDGYYGIGRVMGFASQESSDNILIATEEALLEMKLGIGSITPLMRDAHTIVPSAIADYGKKAVFFCKACRKFGFYNFETGSIEILEDQDKFDSYNFRKILVSNPDDPNILLVDEEKGVFRFNTDNGNFTHIASIDGKINATASYIDKLGDLWLAKTGKGISCYKPKENFREARHYEKSNSPISSDNILCITSTQDGYLCVGGDNGVDFIDQEERFYRAHCDKLSICQCIASSKKGVIAGTPHDGLISIRKRSISLLSQNSLKTEDRLPMNVVSSFYQQKEGTVWFGTAGGGIVRYDEILEQTTLYPETHGMQVTSIAEIDSNHLLLLSLYDKCYNFNTVTGTITPSDINISIADNQNAITCNSPKYIYFFNMDGKNLRYSKNGTLSPFTLSSSSNAKSDEKVVAAYPLSTGVLLTSNYSVYEIDDNVPTPKVLHTSDTRISSSSLDGYGNLWFVTREGLFKYNKTFNELVKILDSPNEGFFTTILIDNAMDKIWLATSDNKLMLYSTELKSLYYYSEDDGLPHKCNYYNYAFGSTHGNMYIPTSAGLVLISPSRKFTPAREDVEIYPVSLTVDSLNYSLQKSYDKISISQNYSEARVEVSVENSNPLNASNIRFVLMKGKDVVKESISESPTFYIGALPHGKYTLYASSFCSKGWSDNVRIADFRIKLSYTDIFTPLLLAITLILIAFAILLPLRARRKEKALMHEDLLKRQNYEDKLKNVALYTQNSIMTYIRNMKVIESRLGGIIGKQQDDPKGAAEGVETLHSHVRKLISISDFILKAQNPDSIEIRNKPIDVNAFVGEVVKENVPFAANRGLELKFIPGDDIVNANLDAEVIGTALCMMIHNAVKFSKSGLIQVVTSMSSLGNIKICVIDEGRGIKGEPNDIFKPFNREDMSVPGIGLSLSSVKVFMDKIGGRVGAYNNLTVGSTVFMSIPSTLPDSDSRGVEAAGVTENRPAAEPSAAPAPEPAPAPKVDIAINVTPAANSAPADDEDDLDVSGALAALESGSKLAVPEGNPQAVAETGDDDVDPFLNHYATVNPETEFTTKGYTLLVVDDQQDSLDFIKEEYEDLFKHIYVAHDGVEGLEMVRSKLPSIIVSDVMMPRMNGFDMCKAIKADIEISHLPVVLLTAKSDSTYQEVGYKLGADAFVPKPFDTRMLYNILKTQLRNRFEIKRQYALTSLPEIPEDYTFSIADEKFIQKLNKYINDNIANPDLSVDMIVDHMCVSRSTLFNKMRSLLGVSSNKYIRKIRMDHAKNLMAKTDKQIFDIAMEVGFTESQYFSTVFKQETGMTPSQYRATLIQ